MLLRKLPIFFACLFCLGVYGQPAAPVFKLVPLGVFGGGDESNLSAYMLAPAYADHYLCLDAGTLRTGIAKAISNKVFSGEPGEVIKKNISAYLISHSHLDHLAGLIINSPDDTAKSIYAFAGCIKTLQDRYFTWDAWANFGDAGERPVLKKYHYAVMQPGEETPVPGTAMTVKAFPLSHSNLTSTAFLVSYQHSYMLYLGDTGPDAIEKSENLHHLWQAIAPLIKDKSLKAIMIETSFPDEQPDKSLFGHFTPRWLMTEMENLSRLTGKAALKNFNIVITHRKPPMSKVAKIQQQLTAENKLQLRLIFPQQGKVLWF